MNRFRLGAVLFVFAISVGLVAAGCTSNGASQREQADQSGQQRAVALGPSDGTELWFAPSSRDAVGDGAVITLKIDRISVPYARMMAATQTLAATGIPVHLHTFEDELIYVLSGHGFAVVGDDREEIPLEPGSVAYIPSREWHGVENADPDHRMEILVVTTPSAAGGLADFFRNAAVRPGHPPLDLSEEEFLALFHEYGMRVPSE